MLPRTVLPWTVKLVEVPLSSAPPVKVVRPVLSMVRRSVSWPLLALLLVPAVVVLKIRLPPHLPVASCASSSVFDSSFALLPHAETATHRMHVGMRLVSKTHSKGKQLLC